ncbi:transmembrane amino acid transporter protein-domain-containing protein [Russula vinacea]|nr:transmembrane amino acid transporter protein-domain-containing protein [Russula vinacea]
MTSPSRPVNIVSPRFSPAAAVGTPSSRRGPGSLGTPAVGTPYSVGGTPDIRSLRAQYVGTPPLPNIPPRTGTSTPRPSTSTEPIVFSGGGPRNVPSISGISARRPATPIGLGLEDAPPPDPTIDTESFQEDERVKVLRKHLVSRGERQANYNGSSGLPSRQASSSNLAHELQPDPEAFPVPYHTPGADITHGIYKWQQEQTRLSRPRAVSFSGSTGQTQDPAFEHIHEPGGFRRNYVLLQGTVSEEREPPRMLNNLSTFCTSLDTLSREGSLARILADAQPSKSAVSETSPLLPRSSSVQRSRTRRRRVSVSHGDATVGQAVLMLLKSFVGTGFCFWGKHLGGALYGPWMRYAILTSITISQIGFVAAYTIFVAENLQSFVYAATRCTSFIPVQYLILMQLIIFLPMALIRNLAKLSTTALVADVFILAGLVYIFGSEFGIIAERGIAKVELFNPKDFPLLIGTAVFSFEGIGLVIPITDSMREPHKFPMVLSGVMIFLLVLFGGAGALSYLTFGSDINTVVLKNLDSSSRLTQAFSSCIRSRFCFPCHCSSSPPCGSWRMGSSLEVGNGWNVKWQKNTFRFVVVMGCTILSWAGAKDLDKFVAFVGSFACVPLCYVYPAMLHYKACARTWKQKAADIALGVFGVVAAIYTTVQTLVLMAQPDPPASSPIGNCDIRRF